MLAKLLILVASFVGKAAVSNSGEDWIQSTAHSALPLKSVFGGYEADHSPLFVGRAHHEGGLLPAKVSPIKGFAYVANNGEEHRISNYEVLVGEGYCWVPDHYGHLPANAVGTGANKYGETMFIGRSKYKDSLLIGRIHQSHGCIYVPFEDKEIKLNEYEVLVHN
ncbi:uncharacterized protein Dana_GF21233 [Drosophila ananassae]|uniref:Uncharacterized protein n=1 Tax=Drosophila ananassae TaxID=7217 RepID=B3MU31_DROAN|nr:uncharacterized protein Dana_GF21233 [Drosophila ananassae]